jgi:HTH-type transcriptional regulator / antitoxin HigA
MDFQPIHTEGDYKVALQRISVLVDADPKSGTTEGNELKVLGALVQAYEAQHFPMDQTDPIKAIKSSATRKFSRIN